MTHTVEGMQAGDDDASAISARRSRAGSCDVSKMSDGNPGLGIPFVLAAAGEAAVSGFVRQAIADSVQPLQDDFAYYINDGVYGAFNNLLFDHAATIRPRKLRHALSSKHQIVEVVHGEGNDALRTLEVVDEADEEQQQDDTLYPSTVFGPTCDSIDVLSRGKSACTI
jgi:ornithine decarboxylase